MRHSIGNKSVTFVTSVQHYTVNWTTVYRTLLPALSATKAG